jgi:spore maturation protein CgeB
MKFLITSTVPDRINTNSSIRKYVTDGFRSAFPEMIVNDCPLSLANSLILKNKPDVVIAIGGLAIDNVDLWSLRAACDKSEAKLVLWLHDDPYEFDYSFKVNNIADIVLTNDAWAKEHYNHPQVHHLPLAGCHIRHFREISAAKKIDAFFCGVAYPNRINIFHQLVPVLNNFKTKLMGDNWPSDIPFAFNKRINTEQFCDIANKSTIVFNIGRDFNLANKKFELVPTTPGPRTFEVALAGAAQMYFVDSLEIIDYFSENDEILLFDNVNDVRRILERAIDEPGWILDIAQAAQNRALKEHTYMNRAITIMQFLNF